MASAMADAEGSGDPGSDRQLIRVGGEGHVGIDDVRTNLASYIQVMLTEAQRSTGEDAWMLQERAEELVT